MTYVLIAILVLIVLGAIFFVTSYNRLVRLPNRSENAWAQVDVQPKPRHDLIPNLVETVKGYATHERETFENVTRARTAAMNAGGGVADKAAAENVLSGTLKTLFSVAEAYPELKANTNFLALQEELSATENRIGF